MVWKTAAAASHSDQGRCAANNSSIARGNVTRRAPADAISPAPVRSCRTGMKLQATISLATSVALTCPAAAVALSNPSITATKAGTLSARGHDPSSAAAALLAYSGAGLSMKFMAADVCHLLRVSSMSGKTVYQ